MEKLAVHGGQPVRATPLPPNYPGAVVMGQEESEHASRVIKAQSPFRFYGENLQHTVNQLEDMMSERLGVPYVLGVSSCTAALVVALKSLGIGYGDKVIVPSVTFIATAGAVVCSNAVPVFADVDDTLNLDPNDLERLMDDEVKAIIAVPILGAPCDMDPIMTFARKHGLHVIEDVAQSCGVMYKGRPQGTIGDINVFSFQMNKMLTAGEGGAIATSSPELFERAVRYHDQGSFRKVNRERYSLDLTQEAFVGQNYRMSEITGAVLIEQWKKLDWIIKLTRRHYAEIKGALMQELPQLRFRRIVDEEGHLGANLGMIFPSKEAAASFTEALNAENVGAHILYGGKPVYMNPQLFHQRTAERNHFPFDYPFKQPVIYTEDMCPRAMDLCGRTVFVPISPVLDHQDLKDIVHAVKKVYQGTQAAEEG